MVWRLGGAGLFLPLLLCASLALCGKGRLNQSASMSASIVLFVGFAGCFSTMATCFRFSPRLRFLPCLLVADLCAAEDLLFSDYFVQSSPAISSATTRAQLEAYANVTHILNSITFQSTFCSNPNYANNTLRYQALVANFANLREIHGFLSVRPSPPSSRLVRARVACCLWPNSR